MGRTSQCAEVSAENNVTIEGPEGPDEEWHYVLFKPVVKPATLRFTLKNWNDNERTGCLDFGLVDSGDAA